jgi:superfamily II DNA or RNA helicase
MKIEIVNPIEARTNEEGSKKLASTLCYTASYWRKGQWAMRRYEYSKSLIKKQKDGYHYFLAGFIPRVRKANSNTKITTMFDKAKFEFKIPDLKGIEFRPDQLKLIDQALKAERGVVVSPTGSGKTILQMGLITTLPKDFCTLILAHTKDIVMQTSQELHKFNLNHQMIIEGHLQPLKKTIVVATVQSFIKYNPDDYMTYFDCVIVDEGHHVSSIDGNYGRALGTLLAPYRWAFTATKPVNKEAEMALEGLIGPTVARLTINEAAKLNIIAKPKIKIIKLSEDFRIRQLYRSYEEVVEHGIVKNDERTDKIATIVKSNIHHKRVVLIMVNRIDHGNLIKSALMKKGVDIPFVNGATPSLERVKIKTKLIEKKLFGAICTTVWKEGVNIPSLNMIVLAHLGKSEIVTLQNIGRGLRRTDDKDRVSIVDFFDSSHNYLIKHFGERICLYLDEGWL